MPSHHARFTLVELMVGLAIVATLAAIAIPVYADYRVRAKEAEVPAVTQGLGSAFLAYLLTVEPEVGSAFFGGGPDGCPGRHARPYVNTAASAGLFEWEPDGEIYGSYSYAASQDANEGVEASVYGAADPDEDWVWWTCTRALLGESGVSCADQLQPMALSLSGVPLSGPTVCATYPGYGGPPMVDGS